MSVRRTNDAPPAPKTAGPSPKNELAAAKAAVANEVKEVESKVAAIFGPPSKPLPKSLGKDGFAAPRGAAPANAAIAPNPTPFATPTQGQWTLDAKGRPADPVTIYAHGSLAQVEGALTAAGWTKADPGNALSDAKYAGAAVAEESLKGLANLGKDVDGVQGRIDNVLGLHQKPLLPEKAPQLQEVNEMPVSAQTFQGRPLAAAYERHNDPLGGRDHLRIFDTGQKDPSGKPVYAIAASRDSGIRLAPDHPETAFLFHAVQPDVAGERDAVLQSLQQGGGAKVLQQLSLAWSGSSVYGEKVGDGTAYDVALR